MQLFSRSLCAPSLRALSSTRHAPLRQFSLTSIRMAPVLASSQETHTQLSADLQPLLRENGGSWALSGDGKAIEVGWEFGGFAKAWAFMNAVAEEAKTNKHHPEWSNTYNRVTVRWTTHRDRDTKEHGLTPLDVFLATRTQSLAQEFGAKHELTLGSGKEEGLTAQIDELDECSVCQKK